MQPIQKRNSIYVYHVEYSVRDLNQSIRFYRDKLGLKLLSKTINHATFTSDGINPLFSIIQTGIPNADVPKRLLHHLAFALPSRYELGKFLHYLIKSQIPILGAIDHHNRESIYLEAPDGMVIEIAYNRKAFEWNQEAEASSSTQSDFDYEGVYYAYSDHLSEYHLPEGTTIGHIAMNVESLLIQKDFYSSIIGLQKMSRANETTIFIGCENDPTPIGLVQKIRSHPSHMASEGAIAFSYPNCESLEGAIKRISLHDLPLLETSKGYMTYDYEGNKIYLSLFQ